MANNKEMTATTAGRRTKFRIAGRIVRRGTTEGIAGLRVVATDNDIDFDQPIGFAYTRGNGRYAIDVPASRIGKGENGGPDVVIKVFDRNGSTLAVSPMHGFEASPTPTLAESDPSDVGRVLRDQYALARRLHDGYVASLKNWAPGGSPPPGLALMAHTINHFDGDAFAGRSDGVVLTGALTRSQSLVFTPNVLDAACRDGTNSRRPAYLGRPGRTSTRRAGELRQHPRLSATDTVTSDEP